MSRSKGDILHGLKTRQVLFSCEGTAEKVIMSRLANDACLVVPNANIVRDMDGNPYTTLRRAKDIQREFLGIDYPDGLLIARIVDVRPGAFKLDRPYQLRDIIIADFITRPEIESLILVRAGRYRAFQGRRGHDRQLNASDWCIQKLGMNNVKSERFLTAYWQDVSMLVKCIRELHTLQGADNKQLGLINLIK